MLSRAVSESRKQQLREGLIAVQSQLQRRVSKLTQVSAFEPSSNYYRGWWVFTTLCALATSLFTPWELAFTAEAGLSPYDDVPAIVEYFLTSVFVVDIIVHLNLGFVTKEGRVESNKKAIVMRYLRFMFWIDLIGVIPFSTLLKAVVHSDEDQRSLALLRLTRLVRARRLWAFFRDFEINTRFHQIATTLIRNFTIVFLVAHCAACAFYYTAREYGLDHDTWIGANLELISNPDDEVGEISWHNWKRYVCCFYWSITTMTTVGYGDYSPKNIAEVIFATIYMLFNIALNAYILGTITLVVIRTDEATNLQRKGYEELETFAKLHELSPEFVTILQTHLRYNYMNQAVKESELLNNLPSNIRRKVLFDLYGEKLRQFPIFQNCSLHFIAALLEFDSITHSFDVEKYLPDDEIVSKGDVVHALHFLMTGQVLAEDDDEQEITVFPLEPFKKENISQKVHVTPLTVKATATCNILKIPHQTLFSALQLFEEDRIIFYQWIEEHFRESTPAESEDVALNGQMQDSTEMADGSVAIKLDDD